MIEGNAVAEGTRTYGHDAEISVRPPLPEVLRLNPNRGELLQQGGGETGGDEIDERTRKGELRAPHHRAGGVLKLLRIGVRGEPGEPPRGQVREEGGGEVARIVRAGRRKGQGYRDPRVFWNRDAVRR